MLSTRIRTACLSSALAVLCACQVAPPATENDDESLQLSRWNSIVSMELAGRDARRTVVGYLESRYDEVSGIDTARQFVYTADDLVHPVGFRLSTGKTFRYITNRNGEQTSEELGIFRVEESLRRLLGVSGTVELGPPPSKAS